MYNVYLLLCKDNTLYCGIAVDINKRIKEHNGLLRGGAKYTSARRPVKLVYIKKLESRSEALKWEFKIKKMKRSKKLKLIQSEAQQ